MLGAICNMRINEQAQYFHMYFGHIIYIYIYLVIITSCCTAIIRGQSFRERIKQIQFTKLWPWGSNNKATARINTN
jgi:hypothetical protein